MKTSVLLRHELRLWWRELAGRGFNRPLVALIALGLAALFAWLWPQFAELREVFATTGLPVQAIYWAAALWGVALLYAANQAVIASLTALFDRGDLDLLLSSPLPPRRVLATRLVGAAVQVFLGTLIVVVPLSAIAVLVGLPQLLGIYPALAALTLAVTSLAMLFTLVLVRLVGPRTARTLVQIVTGLLSALVLLVSQLPGLLGAATLTERLAPLIAPGGPLAPESALWFPVRAIFFDPPAVIATLGFALLLATGTTLALERAFVEGSQQPLTATRRPPPADRPVRFGGNLAWLVLGKEWRVLLRNPYLLSRTLLQLVLVVPVLVLTVGERPGLPVGGIVAAAALSGVFLGSQIAGTLVTIGVATEEAPDLLASSPAPPERLIALKLAAALVPPWLLLTPAFGLLALAGRPWVWPWLVFVAATASTALLRLWNCRPVDPVRLFSRRREDRPAADLGLSVIEAAALFAWAALALAVVGESLPWIGAAALGLTLLHGLAWWRSRTVGTVRGF